MSYKAFISYSHAADSRLAPALQSALQRFARPFYRRRALDIFRDKTSLRLTPGLRPEIQSALAQSGFFILLASPEAARSERVRTDVDEWLRLGPGSVQRAALSRGAKFLLTVRGRGEAQIWHVADQLRLATLWPELEGMPAAEFDEAGASVRLVGLDGTGAVYACDLCGPLEDLLRLARRRVTRGLTKEEEEMFL